MGRRFTDRGGAVIERLRVPRQILPAVLVALAFLGFACGHKPPPPQARILLRQGEIHPGETVTAARLPLQAGEYLRVSLEHGDGKVGLDLLGPDEKRLKSGGPASRQGVETLSVVTRHAGAYCLSVTGPQKAPPVHYELFVDARHLAYPEDRSRVEAQEFFAEGLRSRDEQGEFQQALLQLQKALSFWRAADDVEGEVDTLNEIGWTEIIQRHPPEALKPLQAALARAQRAHYVRGQANVWNNLGVARSLEQSAQALPAYRQAITLWKALGDRSEQGKSLYNLGLFLADSLDLDQARQALEESLSLRGEDRAGEAYSLGGLGLVAERQGDLDEALKYYERARDRNSGNPVIEAAMLSNIAAIHLQRGDLQAALNFYDQSLANDPGDPGIKTQILHNLATVYYALGEPQKALARYQAVLQQGDPGAAAIIWNSIGTALLAMGDTESAVRYFEKSLQLSQNAQSKNPEVAAQALYNLGRLHMDAKPEVALKELDQALALRNQRPNLLARANTQAAIGATQIRLGRFPQATESFAQALVIATRMRARTLMSRCLLGQARLERARGSLREALVKSEQGLNVVEGVRSDVGSDDLRTSYFAANREYYDFYVDLLKQMAGPQGDAEYLRRAFAASEEARARGLRDLLAEGKIDVASGISLALKREETALANQLLFVERQLEQVRQAATPAEGLARQLEEKLLKIERKQQVLVARIRRENPRYAEVRYPKRVESRSVQKSLDPQSALLEYAVGEERTTLFVVTRERLTAYTLPFGARDLTHRVGTLRKALQSLSPVHKSDYLREAAALYRDLVAPAARSLEQKREILVCPDGVLHLLPFEALLTEKPGDTRYSRLPFLLRRYAISYVPSASVLAGLRAARPRFKTEALVAFAKPLTPGLAPLPESEKEVRAIAALFPPGHVQLYLGQDATKDKLLTKSFAGTTRVHFAVHGILNEQWPQLSGLALTHGQQDDDGFLRVHDIFNLRLNADLVVLSACDTAGTQVNGEGLVGLTRAFFYAGASSLVVSLWRAAEDSAPRLMVDFYRQMAKGKAEALRAAKLELIDRETYAHPFYWAPFVLIGEPH